MVLEPSGKVFTPESGPTARPAGTLIRDPSKYHPALTSCLPGRSYKSQEFLGPAPLVFLGIFFLSFFLNIYHYLPPATLDMFLMSGVFCRIKLLMAEGSVTVIMPSLNGPESG